MPLFRVLNRTNSLGDLFLFPQSSPIDEALGKRLSFDMAFCAFTCFERSAISKYFNFHFLLCLNLFMFKVLSLTRFVVRRTRRAIIGKLQTYRKCYVPGNNITGEMNQTLYHYIIGSLLPNHSVTLTDGSNCIATLFPREEPSLTLNSLLRD